MKRILIFILMGTTVLMLGGNDVKADTNFDTEADNLGFNISSYYQPVEKMYDAFFREEDEFIYSNGTREYTTEIYSAMLEDSRNSTYNIILYRINADPGKSKTRCGFLWLSICYVDNYVNELQVISNLPSDAEMIDFEPVNAINTYSGSYSMSVGTDGASTSTTYNWSVSDMEILVNSSFGDNFFDVLYDFQISSSYTRNASSHYGMFIYQDPGLSSIQVSYRSEYVLNTRIGDNTFGETSVEYYSDSRWYD